jgi:hypothetical protein
MRSGLMRIYGLIRELTGADPERTRDFVAYGMLINTLVALDFPGRADEEPLAEELYACALKVPERQRLREGA